VGLADPRRKHPRRPVCGPVLVAGHEQARRFARRRRRGALDTCAGGRRGNRFLRLRVSARRRSRVAARRHRSCDGARGEYRGGMFAAPISHCFMPYATCMRSGATTQRFPPFLAGNQATRRSWQGLPGITLLFKNVINVIICAVMTSIKRNRFLNRFLIAEQFILSGSVCYQFAHPQLAR
jgi:hypothetical protein